MEVSGALIQRFLKGNCNADEAAAVLTYLESHPEAMEEHLGQQEWDQVSASAEGPSSLQSARMLKNIQHALSEKPLRRSLSWRYLGVAASLILIAGTLFFLPGRKISVPHTKLSKYTSEWKLIHNKSATIIHHKLEDGSVVDLHPGSSITLPEHFPADQRNIKLTGRAVFQVTKDSKRPFTVTAEKTATTALGTKFLIDARSLETTAVSLLEGKVVIKVAGKGSGTFTAYYLMPNQQLIHTKQSGKILIKPIPELKGAPAAARVGATKLTDQSLAGVSFQRAPLVDVFRTLAQTYRIRIEYPSKDLQNHYFTGSFPSEDTLDRMLQVVSEVNDLQVRKTRSGYQIIKTENKFHQK